jgi:uncharacterized protein DUF2059
LRRAILAEIVQAPRISYDKRSVPGQLIFEEVIMRVVLLTGALFLSALTALAQNPAPVPQTPQQPIQMEIVVPRTIDPAKEAEIRRLLDVIGGNRMRQQVMESMASVMKTFYEKNLPNDERAQKFNAALFQKMKAHVDSDELTEKMIEIYDRHFSDDDIRGLIQFYESPVGKKCCKFCLKSCRSRWQRERNGHKK